MKEHIFYFFLYLFFSYIFVLLVLRGIFFVFVLKKEPLESIKILPKIKFKINRKSILAIAKKENKMKQLSKWG